MGAPEARRRIVIGIAALIGVVLVAVVAWPRGSQSTPRSATPALFPTWRGSGRPVTLAFGGDVHFEGAIGDRLAADPRTALGESVAGLFAGSDLSMANLETALTGGGCPRPQPKAYVFHTSPAAITALQAAHVTLVTEANNHGVDCGRRGLQESLAIANARHYPIIGIGLNAAQAFAPYRALINGQRIVIIAATQVLDANLQTAWTATDTQSGVASAYNEIPLLEAVRGARRTADTVVVYLHWGTEKEPCPNAQQPPLAAALVGAGADIVVGAHAHVQLGAGFLGSALVDYGLGNLAFYAERSPGNYSGALLVTVTGRRIDGFRWRPALISAGRPTAEAGPDANAAIRRWTALRTCTNLSADRMASRASVAGETVPLHPPAGT